MDNCLMHVFLLLALSALSHAAAQCTRTTTVYTTSTNSAIKTSSTTLPSTTVYLYSSTVLVGTPYSGPHPVPTNTGNPINCKYTTLAGAKALQVGTSVAADAAICSTTTATVTVVANCKETEIISPAPVLVQREGTLTTSIPSFCTSAAGTPKGTGDGNSIFILDYPYFPQTLVECCVQCSEQYYDLVAVAFISGSLSCECLIDTDGDYPRKSNFCPHGIEPYHIGTKPKNVLPGPCRK